MAEVSLLESLPTRTSGSSSKYDEWLDGRVWKLSLSGDAPKLKNMDSFRSSIGSRARTLGKKVETRLDGDDADVLLIQVTGDLEETTESSDESSDSTEETTESSDETTDTEAITGSSEEE